MERRRPAHELRRAIWRSSTIVDLLLTVATLLVAIYAVVPRARQLDLRLRIQVIDWIVLVVGSLAVTYLQFYEFFKLHSLSVASKTWFPRRWLQGISPHDATYLVILVMMLWLVVHLPFARLSRRKLPKFRDLVEELYWAASYSELFALFQRHHDRLFKIYHTDFLLSRLRRYLTPDPFTRIRSELLLPEEGSPEPAPHRLRDVLQFAFAPIVPLLPAYERAVRITEETLRTILLSPRVVDALSKTRPYLGLDFISRWRPGDGVFDFVDLYIRALLADPTSILYSELRNNQNSSTNRYYINPSNRLLSFFLAKAQVAHEYEVYRPPGEYALAFLDELAREPNDPYCLAMDDFDDKAKWHSPLFAIIRFFDIMVTEALFQGIEWHMWLYYMPLIIQRMVRNYRLDDRLIDPEAEWPNRYSFLIYTAIDAMRNWVRAVEAVDPKQSNVVLEFLNAQHDNGNIPKSAIIALSQSIRSVLTSTVGDRYKAYIADIAFRLFFGLRSIERLNGYGTVLKKALVQGGSYSPQHDDVYREALAQAFNRERREYLITQRREFVSELEAALAEECA
jgi:hypothetical protein